MSETSQTAPVSRPPWWSRLSVQLAFGGLVYLAFGALSLGVFLIACRLASSLGPGRRHPSKRSLRFTREGKYFVAITVGVGFAAINTGNNLLFLVLGMQLSMILVSGVLSEHTLRGLRPERSLPEPIFAGRAFLTGISLRNSKTRLPSFSIQVKDRAEKLPSKRCYFLKVPAGQTQHTSYRTELARRGWHDYTHLELTTRFPFSFFAKTRSLTAAERVLVLPRVHLVAQLPPQVQGLLGSASLHRKGTGQEFFGLRAYVPGDPVRSVHWKRSAREGRLISREFEADASPMVRLWLNREAAEPRDEGLARQFDRCVDLCASLLTHLSRAGYDLQVSGAGLAIGVSANGDGLTAALHALAVVELCDPISEIRGHNRGLDGWWLLTPEGNEARAPDLAYARRFVLDADPAQEDS